MTPAAAPPAGAAGPPAAGVAAPVTAWEPPPPGGDGWKSNPSASLAGVRVAAEVVKGAGHVAGHQFNTYIQSDLRQAPAATPWEDELVPVQSEHMPLPDHPMDAEQVSKWLDLLLQRRLFLLKHAPAREAEAISGMRAVLLALTRSEPGRQALCSGLDSSVGLQDLLRSATWRSDRRGTVIYFYRNDSATLQFFASIERVNALCRRLAEMDCHLVITAAVASGTMLRDESELTRRVALWTFEDTPSQQPTVDPAAQLGEAFDITLALLAGLFPGLALKEFMRLAEQLAPEPPPTPAAPVVPAPAPAVTRSPETGGAAAASTATTPPPPVPVRLPPTRQERWAAGDRDRVLQELGIGLMRLTIPGEAGPAATEAGLYFEDAGRRTDVPAWLYRRAPVRLAACIDRLTSHYLHPDASRRYCMSYRRMLQAMQAGGVFQMSSAWLLAQFRCALDGDEPSRAVSRIGELLLGWVDDGESRPIVIEFMAGLQAVIAEQERHVVRSLAEAGLLAALLEAELLPLSAEFWHLLHRRADARPAIEQGASVQAVAVDLLMELGLGFPGEAAQVLAKALGASIDVHAEWLGRATSGAEVLPVVSLARVVFRQLQDHLLRSRPADWLDLNHALARQHGLPPPAPRPSPGQPPGPQRDRGSKVQAKHGRWLLWDCIFVLSAVLEEHAPRAWPEPMAHALLDDPVARARFAELLAAGLRATAPDECLPAGAALPAIDTGSAFGLYQLLGTALAHRGLVEAAGQSAALGDLMQPWEGALTAALRLALVDAGRAAIDDLMALRDNTEDRAQRREHTQHIQAWQLVLRQLRSDARDARPGGRTPQETNA